MVFFFAVIILVMATSSALCAQVIDCTINNGIIVYRKPAGRWKTESYENPIYPEVLRYSLEFKPLGPKAQGYR